MSVDDWARHEAEKRNLSDQFGLWAIDQAAFAQGIVHAFDALLSDEAVEAAAKVLAGDFEPDAGELHETRLMLQAAIDAVTKEASND